MRIDRSVCLSQGLPWLVLYCILLLVACDSNTGNTPNNPSPAIGSETNGPQVPSPAGLSAFETLSEDILIPPEQPILSLSASTGILNFQWQPLEEQHSARLYRYDPQADGETLVHEFDDSTASNWQLPSQTHMRPWHRQQYRVELCTPNNCLSSPRVPLSGLAPYTINTLSPAVFVEGERYADRIALNQTATLAVLTLPVEGALEFQLRIGEQWILTQRLRLDALTLSTTRTLDLALSDTGDTVAIFISDTHKPAASAIRILERLGEAWVETAAWPVPDGMTVQEPLQEPVQPDGQLAANSYTAITVSSQGDQVLLHSDQFLTNYRRTEFRWSDVPYRLMWPDTQAFQNPYLSARLKASAQDAELTRVFTLIEENQQLHLSVWTPSKDAASWQRRAHFPIQGLNSDAPLSVASNSAGTSVIIAGWEDTSWQDHVPVMWRYDVELISPDALSEPTFSLSVTDSLRAPPAEHANPSLVFTADASLTRVALGWRSADEPVSTSTILPDAALSTYVYDSPTRQWLSALELPENLPTLAKQSFAAEMTLSADGSTLMMTQTRITDNADSSGASVGDVLIMR